jgi:hypothetical protein
LMHHARKSRNVSACARCSKSAACDAATNKCAPMRHTR